MMTDGDANQAGLKVRSKDISDPFANLGVISIETGLRGLLSPSACQPALFKASSIKAAVFLY